MTAQEYEKKYINLCKELCQSTNDYSKKNVKRHNKAMGKIQELVHDMSKESEIASEVLSNLLKNKNIAIKSSAAGQCLKYGFHCKEAERILKAICKGEDRIAAFGAEMTLQVWYGKIPGKSL